jgi:type II secretory pathway pseudopilin PulG
MTAQSIVVLGLIALLSAYAALLWRGLSRRQSEQKSARRAQRLQEQLAWDRMKEDAASRADPPG